MNTELYCNWYGKYVKELPEHETEACMDYPHRCNPQDCECCVGHQFDDEGDRID